LTDSFIEEDRLENSNINKYLDENNYFKKFSQEEYNNEIYTFKENLNSDINKNIIFS
jgi:hypothetical protein